MDSVTQIALGAALGQAVLGHKVGYRAALWGGALATLPDLDVFVSMGGAVADFTYHRSFSHSLITLTLLTPLLAWLINKLHGQYPDLQRRWLLLVWLALVTHPILDSFTIYGTQLFWPLPVEPTGSGSIFIIDPLYTVPLLLGVVLALASRQADWGRKMNRVGLAFSSLYLIWGLSAQAYVTGIAEENLAASTDKNTPDKELLVTAGPFNTLLWRVLVMQDDGYLEGYYSLFDPDRRIEFEHYSSQPELLSGLQDHWPVSRLQWFSKGFFKVESAGNNDVIISDLRMGAEPAYVFTFKVAEQKGEDIVPVTDQRIEQPRDWGLAKQLLQRIVSRDN
ncbi:metal-dependent hydrolase [Aliamphritea spongicola]|uniref:metal-dependent hydrolase n=1 Tax=Aliamphritea spongicola TaxID=707589 RepID=UPI00196AC453|nr:metal-dependent hydrolase [Aliamphritea spongicola]MBN3563313.1 metal-dependent hydrolase [Aliamphritea spongicola]